MSCRISAVPFTTPLRVEPSQSNKKRTQISHDPIIRVVILRRCLLAPLMNLLLALLGRRSCLHLVCCCGFGRCCCCRKQDRAVTKFEGRGVRAQKEFKTYIRSQFNVHKSSEEPQSLTQFDYICSCPSLVR